MNEQLINNLLFFCFGFDLLDSKSQMIDSVIKKAYKDATNQGAFNTSLKDDISTKIEAENCKKKALIYMKWKLQCFARDAQAPDFDYDDWHENRCNKIVQYCYKTINNDTSQLFSYGNSQKFVNMTMKYLYLLSIIDDKRKPSQTKELLEAVNGCSDKLHIPIDSYMLDIIIGDEYIDVTRPDYSWLLENKTQPKTKKLKDVKKPSEYIVGWSLWTDYKRYTMIQKEIRKELQEKSYKPIDWESEQWIVSAKKRRKTD